MTKDQEQQTLSTTELSFLIGTANSAREQCQELSTNNDLSEKARMTARSNAAWIRQLVRKMEAMITAEDERRASIARAEGRRLAKELRAMEASQ